MSIFTTESWKACEKELRRIYSSEGRHYHTIAHVEDCLSKLESVSNCENREAVEIAIWFHDAIYDPLRNDNESESATLAEEWLRTVKAPNAFRDEVTKLIVATDHKTTPLTSDEKLIVDIDLSILGSTEKEYDRYSENIRKEYAAFSDEDYAGGRKKVLNHFLRFPTLYSTRPFRERFEKAARSNLERELRLLEKAG